MTEVGAVCVMVGFACTGVAVCGWLVRALSMFKRI